MLQHNRKNSCLQGNCLQDFERKIRLEQEPLALKTFQERFSKPLIQEVPRLSIQTFQIQQYCSRKHGSLYNPGLDHILSEQARHFHHFGKIFFT